MRSLLVGYCWVKSFEPCDFLRIEFKLKYDTKERNDKSPSKKKIEKELGTKEV